jgi:hypothetical protein
MSAIPRNNLSVKAKMLLFMNKTSFLPSKDAVVKRFRNRFPGS